MTPGIQAGPPRSMEPPNRSFVRISTSGESLLILASMRCVFCLLLNNFASVLGWSELALHLAFLIWPMMSILAVFAIARRFCREPVLAALLTLFTPAFLVSGTNIMCDLMLLALWLWSIECWIAGLDRQQWWLLAVSAILATAAALTKYFGISVVPLLAAYIIARDRTLPGNLAWLLIPVTSVVAFELWT